MDASHLPVSARSALADASQEQLLAVLEVMYRMAKADGFVAADELRYFLATARELSGGAIGSTELNQAIAEWKAQGAIDLKTRLQEISPVLGTPEHRRAAYDLAATVATADGSVEGDEMATLDVIGEELDVV